MKVYDGDGHQVTLGLELGRGGEGTVYSVMEYGDLVAKVYHRPVHPSQAEKLRTMVALRTDALLKISAWPVQTLHQRPGGPITGLLMPKVSDYKPIHLLYGPRSRVVEFSGATFPFVVHSATNLARAFAVVHAHGQVVGDVNESNVRVSPQGTVKFIDSDSFQITSNGHHSLCEVGVPTHQPPEMLALPSYHGVIRTPNHDCFGLAVLLFQLLMMGRHPFAGRYLGSGEMPIERAIKERRFAYGRQSAARQMMPPPSVLAVEALSQPVVSLFERAFAADGTSTVSRPTAEQWITALEGYAKALRVCTRNSSHSFLASLNTCPLCNIEASAGILLFKAVRVAPLTGVSSFNVSLVWAEITAIKSPGLAPALPSYTTIHVTPTPLSRRAGRTRRLRNLLGILVVVLSVAAWIVSETYWALVVGTVLGLFIADLRNSRRKKAKQALDQAKQGWEEIERRWAQEAGDSEFQRKKQELEKARDELSALPNKRRERLRDLETRCRETALKRYLDSQRIFTAKIANVGPGRKATLRSYGVETAADVTPIAIAAIPGFGPVLTANLLAWRKVVEQAFVFDSKKGVDPSDIAALDGELLTAQNRLQQMLSRGATELKTIAQDIEQKRVVLRPEADRALEVLAHAHAEWQAC